MLLLAFAEEPIFVFLLAGLFITYYVAVVVVFVFVLVLVLVDSSDSSSMITQCVS